MRAVLVHVTEQQLADRRAKGLDRWDEMWEGVLHMTPAPSVEHQRIPDLTFVAAGRAEILHEDGVRGGGPDVLIEIRSPEDETYEKLPFFAALAVSEVIVIHRDTKRPELYRLAGSHYVALQEDSDGGLGSEALGMRFRRIDGERPRLAIEDARHAVHAEI